MPKNDYTKNSSSIKGGESMGNRSKEQAQKETKNNNKHNNMTKGYDKKLQGPDRPAE